MPASKSFKFQLIVLRMSADVLIVGLIVLAAVVAIIFFLLRWRYEKKEFERRARLIVEKAKNAEPSVMVD